MNDVSVRAGLATLGLEPSPALLANATAAVLYEISLARGEGRASEHGALVVETAPHTGRSPADKFIVKDEATAATVWWDNNQAMDPADFARLKSDMFAYARSKRLFAQDLHAGADPEYRLSVRVVCELAWHALFIRHMLLVPADRDGFAPGLTVIDMPGFKADPRRHGTRGETAIAIDLTQGLVLIGGTRYAGEMKKAVFTVFNALLPGTGVLPMHCSANTARDGRSAIFFGLSGTGKTTLSADPARILVGDDEHGWSNRGIFNVEGGCYAKAIRLSKDAEPEIHAATRNFATVLENVVMDPVARRLDLEDASLTENTRAAYPLAAIPNAAADGRAAIPRTVIMLAADAFGVLPPVARLTPQQAVYHFLSGYTAKVAGTERGVTEPQAVFSACFGAPFLPRHPWVYGDMLRERIERHGVTCYLVNTGWTGGAYGTGSRMPIAVTRAILDAALNGSLDGVPMRTDPHFGFAVPLDVPEVDPGILDPRAAWADPAAFDAAARRLVSMFVANFAAFERHVGADVRAASPSMALAAE